MNLQFYQSDPSSMPLAPDGYQWAQVGSNPVPQLVPKPKPAVNTLALVVGGAILLAAWLVEGRPKIRPELPRIPMK